MTHDHARPNFLLLTVDSLRADHVGTTNVKTPGYDALVADGVVYENAFSQGPFTTFSMPSLFTSRYPSGLGYLEFSESTIGTYIDEEPTLPQLLRDAGYRTAGFHSNPLLSNLFGFDRGFDEFDARLPLSTTDRLSGRVKIAADKLLRLLRTHAYLPAEPLTKRALSWVDEHDDDRPFFLWIHYMDVHGPYQAKSGNTYLNKYRGERLWRKAQKRPDELTRDEHARLHELYRTEIEYTDHYIDQLLGGLRRRGTLDDTVTVFTADHGELFGEQGSYSHPHMLYDELTHVPLVVSDPSGETGMVERVVELTDLLPTLVARAGGVVPDSVVGSPLPEPNSTSDDADAFAISEADLTPEYNGSIRTPEYRYIRNDATSTEELYDIAADPEAHENLVLDAPEIARELSDRLAEHLDHPERAVGADRDVTRQRIDDAGVEDRLEDLGYL